MGEGTEKTKVKAAGTKVVSGMEENGGQVNQESEKGRLETGMGVRQQVIEGQVNRRFDLLPINGVMECAHVMYQGSKDHVPNGWRRMSVESLINHAINHLYSYLAGDIDEKHLSHAGCRILMAIEKDQDKGYLNLCKKCKWDIANCISEPHFGTSIGGDNVYACLQFVPFE